MFFEIVFYNLIQDDTYNSSRLDNPVSVSFPIDFKALTFNPRAQTGATVTKTETEQNNKRANRSKSNNSQQQE
jgi:hypothetical protein